MIRERTEYSMTEKRLSHAYMLVGPDTPERQENALHLAASLLCEAQDAPCGQCRNCRKVFSGTHPDVIVVERGMTDKGQMRREILVDQIRTITADAVVAPNEAERKVYIIHEADKLNIPAQNALLKALEEPPGHACFVLCTTASDALLPTVRSRCIRVDDTRREEQSAPLSDVAKQFLALYGRGDPAEMVRFCFLRNRLGREETDSLLDELSGAVCDVMCSRMTVPGMDMKKALHLNALLEQAKDYLRHNVSPKQIFGLLAAEIS